jgi:hypothetical protein
MVQLEVHKRDHGQEIHGVGVMFQEISGGGRSWDCKASGTDARMKFG